MQKIIVDDNEVFANELRGGWGAQVTRIRLDDEAGQSPWHAAREVANVAKGDAVVFVNVNLKLEGGSRQEQAGVEVLKFLRFSERFGEQANGVRDAHCVLYSFQSVEQLLRERPSSLILCSDGVTFEQLPSDFSGLDLPALAKKKAPLDDLDHFLRGEFTLPDERHSWANWWAARQMYRIHRLEKDDCGNASDDIAPPTDPQLRNAAYLYDQSDEIEQILSAARRDEIRSAREHLADRLGENSQCVALIDDEAQSAGRGMDFGWDRVFYDMLDGCVLDVIEQSSLPHDALDEQALCQALPRSLTENCACVLLDLRLTSSDPVGQAEGTTGAAVLEAIRERNPTLPVVMTTASNKVASFEQLMRLGADAYWIKQGIDERRDVEDTVQNYERLLNLLTIATGPEYKFLRSFGQAVKELKGKDDGHFWWEQRKWAGEVGGPARRAEIFGILDDLTMAVRTYLHDHAMKYGYQGGDRRRYTVWSIYQHAFKVVEEIHRYDLLAANRASRSQVPSNREDYFGEELLDIRNSASHLADARNLTDWGQMTAYLANVLAYVSAGPIQTGGGGESAFDRLADMRERSEEHAEVFDEVIA